MKKEEAREQLLSQIELELCRIFPGNNNAHKELHEFYDFVSSLHIDNFIFSWYATHSDNIEIKCIDGEVRVINNEDQRQDNPINDTNNELGEIVLDVFRKRTQN